ncbi:hypothetical protein LTR08_004978 [Meristemomyces frigidus]|nr:hypothetical protein LTR08_004978 [Meristemomyces frigidus]
MPPLEPASLLTLPCELRNAIYHYVFDSTSTTTPPPPAPARPSPPPNSDTHPAPPRLDPTPPHHHLALLLTSRQLHTEAHLLALAHTTFRLPTTAAHPAAFALRARRLSAAQLAAVKHLHLTARIPHLRALNESWHNAPFGHVGLRLETLTIVPCRPDASASAYAEVADLSQAHTLAHVFAETLRGLRGVGCVEVRNGGCFGEGVWRVLWRSLVFRLWRWGGGECGIRFESSGEGEGEAWFRVYLQAGGGGEGRGREVGEEVGRLAGGEMPEASTAGVGL